MNEKEKSEKAYIVFPYFSESTLSEVGLITEVFLMIFICCFLQLTDNASIKNLLFISMFLIFVLQITTLINAATGLFLQKRFFLKERLNSQKKILVKIKDGKVTTKEDERDERETEIVLTNFKVINSFIKKQLLTQKDYSFNVKVVKDDLNYFISFFEFIKQIHCYSINSLGMNKESINQNVEEQEFLERTIIIQTKEELNEIGQEQNKQTNLILITYIYMNLCLLIVPRLISFDKETLVFVVMGYFILLTMTKHLNFSIKRLTLITIKKSLLQLTLLNQIYFIFVLNFNFNKEVIKGRDLFEAITFIFISYIVMLLFFYKSKFNINKAKETICLKIVRESILLDGALRLEDYWFYNKESQQILIDLYVKETGIENLLKVYSIKTD